MKYGYNDKLSRFDLLCEMYKEMYKIKGNIDNDTMYAMIQIIEDNWEEWLDMNDKLILTNKTIEKYWGDLLKNKFRR